MKRSMVDSAGEARQIVQWAKFNNPAPAPGEATGQRGWNGGDIDGFNRFNGATDNDHKDNDLVTKAEMEREDYRRRTSPNVFFGTVKNYFNTEFSTLWINGVVIILSLSVILTTIHFSLRRQLTRV